MNRTLLTTASLLSIFATLPMTSQANDIVDFLRAISGRPQYQGSRDHGHERGHLAVQPVSQRQVYNARGRGHSFGNPGRHQIAGYQPRGPVVNRRSGLTYSVALGHDGHSHGPSAPVIPHTPVLPPPPAPGSFGHLPYELGQIVTCPVPLETCVEVRHAHKIHPQAVPVVVAVRNPHLGRFKTCVEELVYVEVLVPPCPLRKLRVSPCRTKIHMNYGRHSINIISRNGVVIIDY